MKSFKALLSVKVEHSVIFKEGFKTCCLLTLRKTL
jgi:hypothetical protein